MECSVIGTLTHEGIISYVIPFLPPYYKPDPKPPIHMHICIVLCLYSDSVRITRFLLATTQLDLVEPVAVTVSVGKQASQSIGSGNA